MCPYKKSIDCLARITNKIRIVLVLLSYSLINFMTHSIYQLIQIAKNLMQTYSFSFIFWIWCIYIRYADYLVPLGRYKTLMYRNVVWLVQFIGSKYWEYPCYICCSLIHFLCLTIKLQQRYFDQIYSPFMPFNH